MEALRTAGRGAEVRCVDLLDPIGVGPAARVGSFPQTEQPSPVGLGDKRKERVRSGARQVNVDAADIRSGERIRSSANHSRPGGAVENRSEEHTSELQSQSNLVCRLLLEKKKQNT